MEPKRVMQTRVKGGSVITLNLINVCAITKSLWCVNTWRAPKGKDSSIIEIKRWPKSCGLWIPGLIANICGVSMTHLTAYIPHSICNNPGPFSHVPRVLFRGPRRRRLLSVRHKANWLCSRICFVA